MADANAASCSSSIVASASTSSSPQYYDAFINHRGSDTKKHFATPLYKRLTSSGLQVFLDKPEMEVGHGILPQIEDAIKVASVHIAIFSQHYAESEWCLNELVSMMKSGKTTIPVFYGVKPEHLRRTGREKDGPYAKALRYHEDNQRHSSQRIQQWKKALSDVSNISGLELDTFNGDQFELMDKLVQTVLQKVPRPLYVAKYPIGLEDKLEEFQRTVLSQPQAEGREEAKVVGIWGLGGTGKSTLARHFFNHERSKNYMGSSFLIDVRDKTSRGNLTSLQCNLIKNLKGKDIKIDSVEEGICKLKDNLSSFHALVILDDINHVDQLDALLPIECKRVLDPNSLIVVTTRDKGVLESASILEQSIYHLTGLKQPHSRQLFCSHAFPLADPLQEFENLIDGFVEACDGLPLSLKVLGSLLCGKYDISYWEGVLDGLRKSLPSDIESRLRISYNSLSEEEKEIFLDIACFCVGFSTFFPRYSGETDKWLSIWGRSGLVGFRNLQNKCLVEVVEVEVEVEVRSQRKIAKRFQKSEMRMHDHIRDMGRKIAESSMPRRLWQPNINSLQDINKLLKQSSSSSEITEVRGIRMSYWQLGSASHEVCRMRGLKFLQAGDHFPESILNRVESPEELIWLRWHDCPWPSLPSSIPMHNLRILEVDSTKLKRLWDCGSEGPEQLRKLFIRAPLVELPNSLGQLKYLESIQVEDSSLETFPKEFNLPYLKYLRLERCKFKGLWKSKGPLRLRWLQIDAALVEFPESLGQLKDLQIIEAPNTSRLVDLCYLPSLHHLQLDGFALEISSDFRGVFSFGDEGLSERDDFSDRNLTSANLANIRSLETDHYYLGLKMVPNFVSNLTNLQQIDLRRWVKLEELPDNLGNFTNLRHIDLSYCFSLKKLPNSFGNLCQLEHLYLKVCRNLTISSETLGNIRSLVRLDLKGCVKMELLPYQVGRQESLEFLRVGTPLLEMLPRSLGCLTSLKKLWLDGCAKLRYLPDSFELLSQLTELKIWKCRNIQYLPPSLGCLTSLKKLWLDGCEELQYLPDSVRLLSQLTELKIRKCRNIQYLQPFLGSLTSLKKLWLDGCDKLQYLPESVELLSQLTELKIRKCRNIYYLPPAVMRMKNLKVLAVFKCPLRELPFKSPSLELLQLQKLLLYRTEVSEVSFPECVCANLQVLWIRDCRRLVKVGELPTTLKHLHIGGCGALDTRLGIRAGVNDRPSVFFWEGDDDEKDEDERQEDEDNRWMRNAIRAGSGVPISHLK